MFISVQLKVSIGIHLKRQFYVYDMMNETTGKRLSTSVKKGILQGNKNNNEM